MPKSHPSVDEFLNDLHTPDLALINKTRKEIAKASDKLVEGIKWNAPSYSLDGNDIITFNFRNFGSVALIFHTGPKGKDTHTGKPLFAGYEGVVEWVADKRVVVRIGSAEWLDEHRDMLSALIRTWIEAAERGFKYGVK
jgi:uncharacterized protein YdeI (YjbR/CyaY-like superfamily)